MANTVSDAEARELIDRAMKLAPDVRESIALELLDSIDADADFAATIARRCTEIAAGLPVTLSRGESDKQIREAIHSLGVEL
jgi:hypothetical protein